jgi:hypothetical protein
MSNDTETIPPQSESTLYGKLMGVVTNLSQMMAICESLETLEVHDVEILTGPSGTNRLESLKETVAQYFFGDMEAKMLQGYLDAVTNDQIVFVAGLAPEIAAEAAELAKTQGAVEVVHFGNSAVTNY